MLAFRVSSFGSVIQSDFLREIDYTEVSQLRTTMLHKSNSIAVLAVSTGLFFIALSLLLPGFAHGAGPWILLASVILIGIPHGAIDHIMAEKVYGLDSTWKGTAQFYGGYLGLMFVVGMLWLVNPLIGMLFFFAISIYHFGQADMEDFVNKGTAGIPWYLVRGSLILGLILFSDTSVSYPIMAQALAMEPIVLADALPAGPGTMVVLSLLYALLLATAALTGRVVNWKRLLADSVLILVLFLTAGPLIGFAVYFALWHSAGHIVEMQQYLRKKRRPMSLKSFYKSAAPFTFISLFGLAVLAGINHAFGLEDQFIALMFILISVLTLPHMVIVDRMYAQMRG